MLPADDFSFTDPFEVLGRAVEQSARAAGALFADISLDGQVDLLTTGAFDSPPSCSSSIGREASRSSRSVRMSAITGAVRAAMNQGDLDSWMLAGSYAARAGVPHRYEAGMSYSLQRYQAGNTAALAALPDTARNVGAVFAYDEWALSPRLTGRLRREFRLLRLFDEPSLLSPRIAASYMATPVWRVRGLATRQLSAPGAQEFLPPTRASWLPPQRTFSLSRDGFRTQSLEHYEVGVDRLLRTARWACARFASRSTTR